MSILLDYLWLIWDAAAVIIIIWCVRHCARRGLVRTVISFLAYFIAIAVARLLGPMLSDLAYNFLVKDAMVLFVSNELGETLASGQELLRQVLDSFPALLERFVPALTEIDAARYASMESVEMVESLVDAVLRDPVTMILQSLCFLLIFSLVLMLTRAVARLFTGLYRVPVIGTLNTFLGGVVGVLQAVIFMVIGALIVKLVILLSGDSLFWINTEIMDQTYIWYVFYSLVS